MSKTLTKVSSMSWSESAENPQEMRELPDTEKSERLPVWHWRHLTVLRVDGSTIETFPFEWPKK